MLNTLEAIFGSLGWIVLGFAFFMLACLICGGVFGIIAGTLEFFGIVKPAKKNSEPCKRTHYYNWS